MMQLFKIVCLLVVSMTSLSAAMTLGELDAFRHFILCETNGGKENALLTFPKTGGFMIVAVESEPALNGILVNEAMLFQELAAKNKSLAKENYKYYASYAESVPNVMGASEIPLNEAFTDIYMILRADGADHKEKDKVTSLNFSNDNGRNWTPIPAYMGTSRFPDESGKYTNSPAIFVKLSDAKGKITCNGETVIQRKNGIDYELLFDVALDSVAQKDKRPIIWTLFQPAKN